jgi:CRISPR-associated endonuclease/helicase Cas3
MENRSLAKSKPKETIAEHTDRLKENYHLLKRCYPGLKVDWQLLLLAVLFHDLGKINTKFQNKLYKQLQIPLLEDCFKDQEEIPHGNLSAALLDRKKLQETFDEDSLKVLYQSIYYHHPRFINRAKFDYFKTFIKEDLARHIAGSDFGPPYFNKEPRVNFSKFVMDRIDYNSGKGIFYQYVLTKGLLNRLDYAASAHMDVEVPNRDLEKKTLDFLKGKGGLRDLQTYLWEHREENNVVVASTGMGKTEAGLLWIGSSKGFFTLPLRVSINAIYHRVKHQDIGFDHTALLHSDALAFLVKTSEEVDYMKEYARARLFSMPLTITTVDQLFKFVFKEEGFEPVLATLAYSKLIIDEIQMYSPDIVACILMGLKYITEIGGKFSILTATFPKVLGSFLEKLGLAYNYKEFIMDRERHRIRRLEEDIENSVHDMIEKGRCSKVLVIVNTVKKAQEVYEALGDIENKYLLHSRFIKRDRNRLEAEIMDFSSGDSNGIWVTTQIVEASLDIDFDYLYTELSTVDGLFQRMGRCFRKRELTDERVNVYIFTKEPSGLGNIIDRDIFELSKEALKGFDNRIISEKEKLAVVGDIYSVEKIRKTNYYKAIRDKLNSLENIPAYELERHEVDEKFRNIRSHTVIPISVYHRHKEMIDRTIKEISELGFSDEDKIKRISLLEDIKELTVDVPHFLSKHIRDTISINRRNTVKIINLEYDSRLGLTSNQVETNIL